MYSGLGVVLISKSSTCGVSAVHGNFIRFTSALMTQPHARRLPCTCYAGSHRNSSPTSRGNKSSAPRRGRWRGPAAMGRRHPLPKCCAGRPSEDRTFGDSHGRVRVSSFSQLLKRSPMDTNEIQNPNDAFFINLKVNSR